MVARKTGFGVAMLLIGAQWAHAAPQNAANASPQLDLALPTGVYRCAYGEPLVGVERSAEPTGGVRIHYRGRVHELRREASKSGLPRFTNPKAGLLWIDLPWKSVLLNLKNERPIANDCTFAPELALAELDKGAAKGAGPQVSHVKVAKKR